MIRLKDANTEQRLFLDDIAHDPSKGQKWIDVMGVIVDCTADLLDLRDVARQEGFDIDSALLKLTMGAMAIKTAQALDEAFPFDRTSNEQKNPIGPALRLDVVKFYQLGGQLDASSRWNESTLKLEEA